MLSIKKVTVRYGNRTAVDEVTLRVRPGEWWMVVGPNGAGKSSLAEAITQSVSYTGEMTLLNRDIRAYKPRELARKIGMLSQRHTAGYAFTVEEIVSLGRYAYAEGIFHRGDAAGQAQIDAALEMTGLMPLRSRNIMTLSGGELQRAFLAQVLAQDPALMILDEPANHLDLPYQKQFFSLIGRWLETPGRAVISVVHDLTLARRFGTHALLMQEGRAVAQGEIGDVMTPEHLRAVYGMDVYGWMRDMLGEWL